KLSAEKEFPEWTSAGFAQNAPERTRPPAAASRRSRSWRWFGLAGGIQRQGLKYVSQAVIHDNFLLQIRQNGLHGLEVKASARHVRRFPVFGQQQRKFLRFAPGFVHPAKGVGFGLFFALFGPAARVWDGVVIHCPGLVDGGLLFLLRLIHVVERRLHGGWRAHAGELHLLNLDSQTVLRTKIGQPLQRRSLNVVPPDG